MAPGPAPFAIVWVLLGRLSRHRRRSRRPRYLKPLVPWKQEPAFIARLCSTLADARTRRHRPDAPNARSRFTAASGTNKPGAHGLDMGHGAGRRAKLLLDGCELLSTMRVGRRVVRAIPRWRASCALAAHGANVVPEAPGLPKITLWVHGLCVGDGGRDEGGTS